MAGFGCQVAVAFEPTGLAQHGVRRSIQIDPVHGLWKHMRATRRHVGVTVSHGRCTGLYLPGPSQSLQAAGGCSTGSSAPWQSRGPAQPTAAIRPAAACLSELSLQWSVDSSQEVLGSSSHREAPLPLNMRDQCSQCGTPRAWEDLGGAWSMHTGPTEGGSGRVEGIPVGMLRAGSCRGWRTSLPDQEPSRRDTK